LIWRASTTDETERSKTNMRSTAHTWSVNTDLAAATAFMATHARALDRRRFQLLVEDGDGAAVLAAADAYRNPDGGYGWGLEPDLRSTESQPGGALHAFEAFADIAPETTPRAVELCDWLASNTLTDGGLPFALRVTDPAGCAPFWAQADPSVSSLQITAYVTATAHRVAAHHADVARHPWLAQATDYCLAAIEAMGANPHALELTAALQLLDVIHDSHPQAGAHMQRLGKLIPASGMVHVGGGTDEEMMRPLDFAPSPDRPVRALFRSEAIAAELRRLADQQQEDGGWPVDFRNYSPAAVLEWRGYATVRAVSILQRNAML
jgi:hypothetical protein